MKEFVVEQIFSGVLVIALPIAFAAGLISFLSPCVLPLVPGYISFAAGFSVNRGKVLLGSILFVLGFSAVFISYGAIFGGLGNQLASSEDVISRFLGVVTIFLGFVFLGRFPFAPTFRPAIKTTGGLIGAPILGFLFGVGWTPCIGPALGAVEALAFQESSAVRGAILSLSYCFGLGLPFILSGVFLDRSQRLRAYLVKRGDLISKIGGVFLIVIGILEVTGYWGELMNSIRAVVSDFVPVM
jgi:cytochrome c-type biogenesis protein